METRICWLRPLEQKDALRMLEWMRDSDVTRHLQIGGAGTTMEDVDRFIHEAQKKQNNLHQAIVNQSDAYLGSVSLKHINRERKEAEYAIALHPDAIGTDVAKCASEEILEIAFQELGLSRVYLNVLKRNTRAIRFYEKFGFQFTHESVLDVNGESLPLMWYEAQY